MSARERERLARVEDLFARAKELPPPERAAFVAAGAGGDGALRDEVLELLALDARHDSPLDRPADPWLGASLGRWKVVSRLGAGGMGVVYVAERDDGVFRQRAALKLLRQGLGNAQLVERFRQERQILAALAHPSIASLIDGGATDEGLPWLVMELVDGTRLDQWCDERRLPLAQRLELFRAICGAVQYAHQMLVVHRDLKPSNVLVTAAGHVKLVDFGISRVLEETRDEGADHAQERHLTPEYAAPEVIRGAPATTSSDVFSLGVLLHELLTGLRPWPSAVAGTTERERAILDARATPPSQSAFTAAEAAGRGLAPERLRRALRGDLDAIVARALDPDPARRYASAQELADDVGRALAHEPVQARAGGAGYRLGRFVRRNRALSGAVLLGLLALGTGAWALVRAALAERRHAQATQRVNEVLGEMLLALDPASSGGLARSLTLQLDAAGRRLDQGLLTSDPLAEIELRTVIGRTYHAFGLGRGASEQFTRALALARGLAPDPALVCSLLRLQGAAERSAGRTTTAVARLEEALALARARLAREPDARAAKDELVHVLHELGLAWPHLGEYARAQDALREALALRVALDGDQNESAAALQTVLGTALLGAGEPAAALVWIQGALELRRRLYPGPDPRLAWSEDAMARVQLALGELPGALEHAERALAMRRALYDEENLHVAQSLMLRGEVLSGQGRQREAAAEFGQALAIRRSLLAPESPLLGYTLLSCGLALAECGEGDAARELLAEGLAHAPEGSPEYARRRARAQALLER